PGNVRKSRPGARWRPSRDTCPPMRLSRATDRFNAPLRRLSGTRLAEPTPGAGTTQSLNHLCGGNQHVTDNLAGPRWRDANRGRSGGAVPGRRVSRRVAAGGAVTQRVLVVATP